MSCKHDISKAYACQMSLNAKKCFAMTKIILSINVKQTHKQHVKLNCRLKCVCVIASSCLKSVPIFTYTSNFANQHIECIRSTPIQSVLRYNTQSKHT